MSDLISRQAAIDAVAELASSMSVCISVDECRGMKRMQGMAVRVLDELPSAQTQRMKGRWISRDGREDCYECSECHAVIESDEVYWRNNYFCYHCGADMRGEQ